MTWAHANPSIQVSLPGRDLRCLAYREYEAQEGATATIECVVDGGGARNQ